MARKKKKEEAVEEEAPEASTAPEGEASAEGGEGAEGEGAPTKGKRKLVVIIGAVVLLLVIAGVAFMLLGHKKTAEGSAGAGNTTMTPEQVAANKPVYYELPEFLVNLNTTAGGRASFIKMSVTLELKDQASVAVLDANKPRIIDTFNTYLHELRPEDVQGSAGIYRLRQELMARINGTVQEGLVKDILFSEIIVQ
ncbi:MAG: flagellar basal body-associated FliL family protein [Alphaproteobacteria bacterium]